MALCKVNTKYFEVVHTSDPDVSEKPEPGAVADGDDAGNSRSNRWLAKDDAHIAADTATVFRVRALDANTVNAGPAVDDPKFRAYMLDNGLHPDDRAEFDRLPWQYARTLGGFIYEVSTYPLGRAK